MLNCSSFHPEKYCVCHRPRVHGGEHGRGVGERNGSDGGGGRGGRVRKAAGAEVAATVAVAEEACGVAQHVRV